MTALDDVRDLVRETAAIGVAEDDAVRARRLGRQQRAERVVGIPLVPVEEVLGVVDDLLEVLEEVGDGVADHRQVLFERRPDRRGDVEVPRLAEDGDDGRSRLDQRLDVRVVLRAHARPPGRAERADPGGLEDRVLHALEEAQVLGIRPGPAALDVVDAERVEALGDADLVLHGEGHTFALGAVPKRRVVDLDLA